MVRGRVSKEVSQRASTRKACWSSTAIFTKSLQTSRTWFKVKEFRVEWFCLPYLFVIGRLEHVPTYTHRCDDDDNDNNNNDNNNNILIHLSLRGVIHDTRFFSTQTQCCFTFSWVKLQVFLPRHFLYLLYLCPCLDVGLLSLIYVIYFSFSFSFLQTDFFFLLFLRICTIIFGW